MSGTRFAFFYTIKDRKVIKLDSPQHQDNLSAWADSMLEDLENRLVGYAMLGDVEVSTTFTGLNYGSEEEPLYFSTMVFGGPLDESTTYTQTWEQAEEAHHEMVARVKSAREK